METDSTVVLIPREVWQARGISMMIAADRLLPDETITYSHPSIGHAIGWSVTVRFRSPESAAMMRLVWSGGPDGP